MHYCVEKMSLTLMYLSTQTIFCQKYDTWIKDKNSKRRNSLRAKYGESQENEFEHFTTDGFFGGSMTAGTLIEESFLGIGDVTTQFYVCSFLLFSH